MIHDTGWRVLPTFNVENWLYIEGGSKAAWLVRVSLKGGVGYMVKNGHRERLRYGKWFPIGLVSGVGELVTGPLPGLPTQTSKET